MSDLQTALLLAANAHHGQTRRNGLPYLLHPFRVMLRMATDEERIAAILHDVIEDTAVTLDDLRAKGFSARVVEAVGLLTKTDGGSSDAYLDRIAAHPLARRVKIADLEDNMNLAEIPSVTEKDLARMAKYHGALKRLKAAGEASP